MADEKFQALFGSFKRLRDFPLDPTCIYDTKEELENYLRDNKTAYPGQILVVLNNSEDTEEEQIYNDRGIYYVISGQEEGSLTCTKALDVKDEENILDSLRELKSEFTEYKSELNGSLGDLEDRINNKFVTIEEFEKITNFETAAIDRAIDSIGEITLILMDFNIAIQHSKSYQYLIYTIRAVQSLIPSGILPSPSIDAEDPRLKNFTPQPNQMLVTVQQLANLRQFVQHSEKIASFNFGAGLYNSTEILGSGNGYTIDQVKIVITHGSTTRDINNFNLHISHSNKTIVGNDDIDFSKPSVTGNSQDLKPVTFIYDMTEKVTQNSSVDCIGTTFNDAIGTIYIKYYE